MRKISCILLLYLSLCLYPHNTFQFSASAILCVQTTIINKFHNLLQFTCYQHVHVDACRNLFAFPDFPFHVSHVAVERTPRIPRRPLTAVTSLKIPNLTTRPIRALLRCSQPPRTGVYNKQY